MNNTEFDQGTEKLYQNARSISSLPLIRFGALAAITVYIATTLLEVYVFLAIDKDNSPWLLIISCTTMGLAVLYALSYTRFFLSRLDTIVLLGTVVITCQHSFYFSYYKHYPDFAFAFSQAIFINLLAIISPSFKGVIRCCLIIVLLPFILSYFFMLERIFLFDAYYFLLMCVGVTLLISQLMDKKTRAAFLLKQELQLEKKMMEELANKDPLTGCFNRRYFNQVGEMEYHRSVRFRHPLSIIMIDIDHFKNINDQYGHPCGDRIISGIAEICQESIRVIDTFARLGGEEFAVILPETDNEPACDVASRLRQRIEQLSFDLEDKEAIKVTVSLGVASLVQTDDNLSNVISRADDALYHAKKDGRNCVKCY